MIIFCLPTSPPIADGGLLMAAGVALGGVCERESAARRSEELLSLRATGPDLHALNARLHARLPVLGRAWPHCVCVYRGACILVSLSLGHGYRARSRA